MFVYDNIPCLNRIFPALVGTVLCVQIPVGKIHLEDYVINLYLTLSSQLWDFMK